MNYYSTIADYCKAFAHPTPLVNFFDVRTFEEVQQSPNDTQDIRWQTEPFRVEFYAVGLLVAGTAKTYLGHEFSANLVFYSPYQLISWQQVEANWEGYYVMFDQDFLAKCGFGKAILTAFPFLRLDTIHPITLSSDQVENLLPSFVQIYQEYHSTHADRFTVIKLYLSLILQLIKRYTAAQTYTDTDHNLQAEIGLVAQYQQLIEQTLNQPEIQREQFTTHYYAQRLNIHPNHLNAVVKRVTRKTAKQLIHKALISTAKALLTQTPLSMKEISYQVGFDEPAHFSTLFKKQTMLTPLEYRQLHAR